MPKLTRLPSGRRSPRSPLHSPGFWPPEHGILRRYLAALLLVAAVALPCAVLYHAATPAVQLPSLGARVPWSAAHSPSDTVPPAAFDMEEEIPLGSVLRDASMVDKTVILTTLNSAWASPDSIIDLFIDSFRIGFGTRRLLDHLIIIALDQKAYARCLSIHIHCFPLITEGVDLSGEKNFMSAGYLDMVWRRIEFLKSILEMGYNFIFSDADIMWFRNPLLLFNPDGDFQIACDHFVGNESDLQNIPNGGFMYVKSNNRTIEFYKFWYNSRERYPGYHDQDVFNFIKNHSFIIETGLKMRFLSTEFFGGICEPSRNLNVVCTMHANCCIGLSSKIHDLKVILQDWRLYMTLPPSVKRFRPFSWRVPQNCSLALLKNLTLPKENW